MALGGLPASARVASHVVQAAALRPPDSRPRPDQPIGTPSMPEIENVVVLMMENHSFDNILGMLPWQVRSRRGKVDGFPSVHGKPYAFNFDSDAKRIPIYHLPDMCPSGHISQDWNASHLSYDHGTCNGFVIAVDSTQPMGYFDQSDLPFSYGLATHFPISDRYFCSLMGQTDPNRRYLFCATSSGEVNDTDENFSGSGVPTSVTLYAKNGTIFDRLDAAGIEWLEFYQNVPSELIVPNFNHNPTQVARCQKFDEFLVLAQKGKLPPFTMLDPNYTTTSEENPQDVAYGENYMAQVFDALTGSPQWEKTALFVTYDEHGGWYDHVPPPKAIEPDDIPPSIPKGGQPGAFNRYGFRVPLYVISPWSRADYVSHHVSDHTSILAFIEEKWNLPALTWRDANAWKLTDMLDFRRPSFSDPPTLPPPPNVQDTLNKCHADGENPPENSPANSLPTT